MFGALIHRKPARSLGQDEIAFDSTSFTLTTAVPRPTERRTDDRMPALLRVAKLIGERGEQLIRIRNMSAGGIAAEHGQPLDIGDVVLLEFGTQKVRSTVVWTRDGTCGIKFDENVDLGELLAGRKARHGFRARPPRLEVGCKASLRIGKTYYTVAVHDMSLGGMKVEPIEEYCLGKPVVVVVESLRPIKGKIRWYSEGRAGVVFDESLTLDELAEWVGKRVEMASLKASYKNN